MTNAVKAILAHKGSTDANPDHELCDEAWCKYKQCTKENKLYTHKNSLDPAIIEAIKPVFDNLSKPDLLKKCLHGRTQNVNESFNAVLWTRIPKKNFVGIQTLKYGTYDAVVTFSEGSKGRLQVLEDIGVKIGKNCVNALEDIDRDRVTKGQIACAEESKMARKRARMIKKNLLDAEKEDEQDYGAGIF